jgi:ATP-dependent Clp protease ATP-binding subunit ClpA
MYIAPALNQVFEAAFKEAENFKDEYVSTEHLLLGIADQKYDPPAACSTSRAPITTPS